MKNIYTITQYSLITESDQDLDYGQNFPYTKNVLKQFLSDVSDLLDKWPYDNEIAKAIVEMTRSIKTVADKKQYANKILLDEKRKDAKNRERDRKMHLRDIKNRR